MSANIVYQDSDVVAFRDINPAAPTHILIVPRIHIENANGIDETTAPLLGKMTLVAKQIAVDTKSDVTGFRLVINNGSDGGQSVNHLHMHFLGGRKLAWPPG